MSINNSKNIDIKDLRQSVLDYMLKNRIIGKRLVLIPVKEVITINKKGIKHLMSRKYGSSESNEIRLQLLKNIPKILSESTYLGFDPNTKAKANIIGIHNFYAIAVYKEKIFQLWIKVKETRGLTFLYDMGIIKEV